MKEFWVSALSAAEGHTHPASSLHWSIFAVPLLRWCLDVALTCSFVDPLCLLPAPQPTMALQQLAMMWSCPRASLHLPSMQASCRLSRR